MSGLLALCTCFILNWIPYAAFGMACFHYRGLLYSVLMMMAAIGFALTPLNDGICRADFGCRPPTMEESQVITAAWQVVITAIAGVLGERAGKRFAGVKLFVSDQKLPTAFALGRNTVCVTRGLLNLAWECSPGMEQLTGVLAHEAAHLHFGDAERFAVAMTANRLGAASQRIFDCCARIVDGVARGVLESERVFAASGSIFGVFISLMAVVAMLVANIASLAMRLCSRMLQVVMSVSLLAVGRKEEFRADLFAGNLGFGPQLVGYLRQIEALDAAPRGIWAVLCRKHPPTAERIDRLIRLVG